MSRPAAQPLTADERRWVATLQRVLSRCPRRLELVTIGDRGLTVISNEHGTQDIEDGKRPEIRLADVRSACIIHGVSG